MQCHNGTDYSADSIKYNTLHVKSISPNTNYEYQIQVNRTMSIKSYAL